MTWWGLALTLIGVYLGFANVRLAATGIPALNKLCSYTMFRVCCVLPEIDGLLVHLPRQR